MAYIQSRKDLVQYCLRALGKPLIEINVDEEQIKDRVEEAIEFYRTYHYDGIEKMYLKHQVTQDDIDNGYIVVPELIYGVTRIFSFVGSTNTTNIFDLQYQLRLNDLYDLTSTSVIYYATVMSHLQLLDTLLNGQKHLRFNRLSGGKLYLDFHIEDSVSVGDYIVVDCYRVLDPESDLLMYNDMFMRSYTTALIKRQWGSNLKKFGGIQLPGGIVLNGAELYEEAMGEIAALEEDLRSKSAPLEFFMG